MLRFCVLFASLSLLSACGFKSLHQTVAADRQYTVDIAPIPERVGQLLRQQLQEDFTESVVADYRLAIELEEHIRYLAILDDATASYGRLEFVGYYTLTDAEGKTVLNDFARSEAGYTIVDSEYASLKAEEDARLKALHTLGNKIQQRVLIGLQ